MSGYHRTPSELEDKATLQLVSRNQYQLPNTEVAGRLLICCSFISTNTFKNPVPYNLYAMQGGTGVITAWIISILTKIYTCSAKPLSAKTAAGAIHGLLAGLHTKWILYCCTAIYQNHTSLLRERIYCKYKPHQRQGLYAGFSLRARFLKLGWIYGCL